MRTIPAKNDLRVTKTLEAIDASFRAMVLEDGYESVTVKALCERARINKKTFYRYYETLDDLLAEVMAGYAYAWRQSTNHLRVPDDLSPRELEVWRLLARGRSNAEMAAELFLSATTVKSHVTRLLGKLGVPNRVGAVVLAYETGLVRAGRPDDD